MSLLLLSINNNTNYQFIKQALVSDNVIPIKCLILDETEDMCLNNLTNIRSSIPKSQVDNLTTLYITTSTYQDYLEEINDFLKDCKYAFLDTHYLKHQNPEMELREWRCLADIINSNVFNMLVVTTYEDTRLFAKNTVTQIDGYCLPFWDSRSEGVSYLISENRNIIYLYPSLYYDELLNFISLPPSDNYKNTKNEIYLPITLTTNLYLMSRETYVNIVIECLLTNKYNIIKPNQVTYKLTGELLNIEFIIYVCERILELSYSFITSYNYKKTRLDKEKYNYFLIHKNHTYCNNTVSNKIIRDNDLTQLLSNNNICFYTWLKQNKSKYVNHISAGKTVTTF